MSGSRVALVADNEGVLVRLVAGIARLESAPLPEPWALVGGVAVMTRLAEAHRVTSDVDTVADTETGDPEPTVAALAAHTGGERVNATSIELDDGTKIDVIPTGTWATESLPDDDSERLNILAHWWAAHTGERLTLDVIEPRAGVVASADIPVATPAALVATKLHAMRARRRAPQKAASDAYDIYRLLAVHDRGGELAGAIVSGPADLAALCTQAIAETFIDEATRWARNLRTYARAGMGAVLDEDLEVTGSLFRDHMQAPR